jgi:hypothetical protein
VSTVRAVVLLGLAGAVLAGCGKSGSNLSDLPAPTPIVTLPPSTTAGPTDSATPTASGSPTASPSPSASGSPEPAISPAHARRLATAAVLLDSDLPGFNAHPQPAAAATDRAFYNCVGITYPVYLRRAYGTAFTKGRLEIDSSADVVASAAQAADQAKALNTARAATCYNDGLKASLEEKGSNITDVTTTLVPVSVPGAADAFAYHVIIKRTGFNGAGGLDIYTVLARVGQTQITITDNMTDTPASLDEAAKLAAIVAGRVAST